CSTWCSTVEFTPNLGFFPISVGILGFLPPGGFFPTGGSFLGSLTPQISPPGLILLFYLVFYGFLAGLFALTMWVMLQSVDPHVPKYQDRLLTPGYGSGRPCLLVKVNRVINFFPGKNKSINIVCAAKHEEDAALLGPLQLFPPNGTIDLMYFPYYGKRVHVNYTQPVVAVQFSNATANVDHHVECRLNAAGLRTDDERDKFAGRVAFRLRINRE
uniref:sodium/potassium-transporting ATPase subunit beta-2 n=1 Tax=Lonchura striata TaxID=40157 RepID=UPI000B4D2A06